VRILVTGAAGFVGRAVVEHLATAGHQVTGVFRERPPLERRLPSTVVYRQADVLDAGGLRSVVLGGEFEGVCHLAGLTNVRVSFHDPLRYFAVNVQGTVNLLAALAEASRTSGTVPRLVFASTAAVYGDPTSLPVGEDHPTRPTSPYGASKLAADEVIGYQAGTGAIGAVSLRCFNVAGAVAGVGDHDLTRLIPRAVAVSGGLPEDFVLNGDGSAVREFVHVADLADAYGLALVGAVPGEHRVFNVGSGIGVSIAEVLRTVERVTGARVPVVQRPPAREPHELVADSTRIRTQLDWKSDRSDLTTIIADAWQASPRRRLV
jgi:UDP-glucose 4-epimerase